LGAGSRRRGHRMQVKVFWQREQKTQQPTEDETASCRRPLQHGDDRGRQKPRPGERERMISHQLGVPRDDERCTPVTRRSVNSDAKIRRPSA